MATTSRYPELAGMLFPSDEARQAAEGIIDKKNAALPVPPSMDERRSNASRLIQRAKERAMQLDQEAQDRVETISAYSAARASLEGPLQAMPETEEEASGDADQKRELPRRPKVSSEDAIKQRRESLKQEEHKAVLRGVLYQLERGLLVCDGRDEQGHFIVRDPRDDAVIIIDSLTADVQEQ